MTHQQGRLIAVVGASGVGKDSLIDSMLVAAPQLQRVRRTITRPVNSGGENHTATTPEAFAELVAKGAFCLHWSAHGYRYGIPANVLVDVNNGAQCVANLSRHALDTAASLFPRVTVLHITAQPETLGQRLAQRGRESADEISKRLDREVSPFSANLDVLDLSNDGPLQVTVDSALKALALTSVT